MWIKNVPRSRFSCYNLDIHDPITIIFGRCVTDKVNKKLFRTWYSEHEIFYNDIFDHFYAVRPAEATEFG